MAGQAALAVADAALNGLGSDAVILVYDAKAKKVVSINAEGTAPKLATIEWYMKNNGGKLPVDDGLLCGTVPGVVDAWYLLLDRWGTMTFAQVLEDGDRHGGKRLSRRRVACQSHCRRQRSSASIRRSMKVYFPGGQRAEGRRDCSGTPIWPAR